LQKILKHLSQSIAHDLKKLENPRAIYELLQFVFTVLIFISSIISAEIFKIFLANPTNDKYINDLLRLFPFYLHNYKTGKSVFSAEEFLGFIKV